VTPSIDELWLASLQKLTAQVAHDLKGALNGVSVNLEVVRSRSEKESTTGADVHRFAASASDQLAVVIRATTALLALGRGTRGPVEVSLVTKQVAGLLDGMGTGATGRLQVSVEGGMAAETAAPLNAVRLALTECLLPVAAATQAVSISVSGIPSPYVQISPAKESAVPSEVRTALTAAGIRIGTDGHGISISLPGPPNFPAEDA
jgi:signal transduction histidine kinase